MPGLVSSCPGSASRGRAWLVCWGAMLHAGCRASGLGAGAWLHALCREGDHGRESQQGVWLGERPEEVHGKGHARRHANRPGLLGHAGWAVPCSLGQKFGLKLGSNAWALGPTTRRPKIT